MPSGFLQRPRPWLVVTQAVVAVLLIAWIDLRLDEQVPLSLLYLLPAAYAGTALSRWQNGLFGAFCTMMAEVSDNYPWTVVSGVPRDLLYFFAYSTAGLYISEVVSSRTREKLHLKAVESESAARQQAEEQLRLLVATSSIAIVTSDGKGSILYANDAALRLFVRPEGPAALEGMTFARLIPAFANIEQMDDGKPLFRTMMQCRGLRTDAEPFFADVWFSTYRTASGMRLNAMIVDTSRDIRDREEANLEQVLNGLRLLVGSVSHEIRNICAAIALVQQNLLMAQPRLAESEDFRALRQLTATLERLSAANLSQVKHQASLVRLDEFFQELRIVVGPSLREAGIALQLELGPSLPTVWADQLALLQVFLNLIRNSESALKNSSSPKLSISLRTTAAHIEILISDNGVGIADPEHLFRPFPTAEPRSGKFSMGLYLSRALLNSFHGNLRYQAQAVGAAFVVELLPAEDAVGSSWRTIA